MLQGIWSPQTFTPPTRSAMEIGDETDYPGSIFRIDPSGELTTLQSFWFFATGPGATLIEAADGSFYGTTSGGRAFGGSTIFRLDLSGEVTTLHSFSGPNGMYPTGRLIEASNGTLYGTSGGGEFDRGAVFKMDPSGELTTLHSFSGGRSRC